jgi:hypothetical protein
MSFLGWLWPPLGFEERRREFLLAEQKDFAAWMEQVYLPSMRRETERQLAEFKEPCLFVRFLR